MKDWELGTYRHFKGGIFEVTAIAKHTENGLQYVVYHPKDKPDEVLVRPYNQFFSTINPYANPEVEQTERFVKLW